ncbi:GNAT family N-acetyltransferase [Acinetobacter ihumii]|uniref:GNAT family N-acetyltransferase n=1 Tax=Acinetobacter ihumii TaxID=2483802 RepID=UPI0010318C17|nr:GNAT family N-acetyltransferase [Acinetobacter ihumii]
MVIVRKAHLKDAPVIKSLLAQLGYDQDVASIEKKISEFDQNHDQYILVAEYQQQIAGFLSLSMIPQLALQGDFARIAYLCVDEKLRGQKVGQTLLAYAEDIAKERGCDRLELHSSDHRKQAHQFYLAQDYEDSPKYFRKFLK